MVDFSRGREVVGSAEEKEGERETEEGAEKEQRKRTPCFSSLFRRQSFKRSIYPLSVGLHSVSEN